MASNKELIKSILERKPDTETEGLNNAQLAELLKAVKAETPDFVQEAKDDVKIVKELLVADVTTDKGEVVVKARELCVPKGKSMCTLAGVKAAGEVVTAKMVTGGVDKLALLKEKGLLV